MSTTRKQVRGRSLPPLKIDKKWRGKAFDRVTNEPLEREFAREWAAQNEVCSTLEYLMGNEGRPASVTDEQRLVANTVVQWLGSQVGQGFLREVSKTERAFLREVLAKAAPTKRDLTRMTDQDLAELSNEVALEVKRREAAVQAEALRQFRERLLKFLPAPRSAD